MAPYWKRKLNVYVRAHVNVRQFELFLISLPPRAPKAAQNDETKRTGSPGNETEFYMNYMDITQENLEVLLACAVSSVLRLGVLDARVRVS